MIALRLEHIGRHLPPHYLRGGLVPERAIAARRKPWVAQLDGLDADGLFLRTFIEAARADYLKSNSVGSRGVSLTYYLDAGEVYEVQDYPSWSDRRRRYMIVDGDEAREITREEAIECLRSISG